MFLAGVPKRDAGLPTSRYSGYSSHGSEFHRTAKLFRHSGIELLQDNARLIACVEVET